MQRDDHRRCGVVTLADSNYFPGLKLLYESVRESWPIGLTCFDIGLSTEQRAFAARHCPGLDILPLPTDNQIAKIVQVFSAAALLAKANKRVWPLWLCPFLIAAAKYERVFWLDSDVVVLRNLRGLFAMLDEGPVLTPENNAPEKTANKPELYALLPIDRSFDREIPKVNAGVSGWDLGRDRQLLHAYQYPIVRACEDERVRQAISWHDQGALIWAIQKLGMEHRVIDSTAWNLCVRHTCLLESPLVWDQSFLVKVKQKVPNANLLHWNGAPVPWSGARNHEWMDGAEFA